jgi:precorrin-2 methylase
MKKDYIREAKIIRENAEEQIWAITYKALSLRRSPVIAVFETEQDGEMIFEVRKYSKRPIQGKLAEFELLKSIREYEVPDVYEEINKTLAKHVGKKENPIYISESVMQLIID